MEVLQLREADISAQVNKYNKLYTSHFFNHREVTPIHNFTSFDDSHIYKVNSQDLLGARFNSILNVTPKTMKQHIKLLSFGCKHLLHEDEWFTTSEISWLNDEYELDEDTWFNTITREDMHNKYFLQFVDLLDKNDYTITYLNFDGEDYEGDFDEYTNKDTVWLVVRNTF